MPPVFVHATGTTGTHARERRRFARDDHCWQCRRALADGEGVAAHVVRYRYPLLCPCAGTLTLATTCRACNARAAVAPAFRHRDRRRDAPRLRRVWAPRWRQTNESSARGSAGGRPP